jgi:hypothetical protein
VEFEIPTRRFFFLAKAGLFTLFTSALVEEELQEAPVYVRDHYLTVLKWCEVSFPNSQTTELRDAFVRAGIVTPKSLSDAFHVAFAFTSGSQIILSWNFKHIEYFPIHK